MLKYYDIINRMSDSDKIRLLSDISCLSDRNYRALGIPEINFASIEDFRGSEYPSSNSIANAWDTELVAGIADDLISKSAESNVGFLKVPSPRIKINPYRSAISEDPLLASELSREYLKAAERADISVGVSDFGLHNDEVEWLDEKPDSRFIYEYIVKPYKDTVKNLKCKAILTEQEISSDNYSDVNSKLSESVSGGNISEGATAICDHVSAEKNVSHLIGGGLFFEGSASALESALIRYRKKKKDIEAGNATTDELSAEILNGKAISPEMLDESVDRMLDFVFSARRKLSFSISSQQRSLGYDATVRSAVLLKNDKSVLPLKAGSSVCIIGDIALETDENGSSLAEECKTLLSEKGYTVIDIARGYDINSDRSEALIKDALVLAKNSDFILLFLGLGKKRSLRTHKVKSIEIPANQQALLDKLGSMKEKIVALMPSDIPLDIGLAENCSAIMMTPFDTVYSAKAISEILSGAISPSGKLANTLYLDTEKKYTEYKTRRLRDGIKSGPFIGYRYYDASGECVGFPFGHGCGYVKFSYSGLSVKDNTVSLTLKNEGKMPASEIVQVYVGKNRSNVIRPLKELCGFARVELQPGEKKHVEIPYNIPKVYLPEKDEFVEEDGAYIIYVGASSADIRLTHKINAGNTSIPTDGQKLSDYIHTESNIITDNFKLEAKFKTMKRSVFNFIAGAVALALAIILKMFCVFAEVDNSFFDIFAVILAISGVIFFIVEAVRRNQMHIEEKQELDKLNNEMFNDADQVPVYSAEKMFVDEFDTTEADVAHEVEENIDGSDSEYFANIDKDQNFERAALEFEAFAEDRGYLFRPDEVKKIFSALSASRLLIVKGMDDKSFKDLMLLLSGYFTTSLYIDRVDDTYISTERVLYKGDYNGNRLKTNVALAIESAKNQTADIHFAALTNVSTANMTKYFSSFANYVKNPLGRFSVTVLNDKKTESSHYISPNLWFVMNLAEGESIDKIPEFISEIATVNTFAFDACEVKEEPKILMLRKFSYYQMDYLTEKTSSGFSVDEELWKKVDRLEDYVNGYSGFHIGNKLWLGLEKFAYVYMACGGEKIKALDEAVAATLMPIVMTSLRGKLSDEDRSLSETVENIFGEDCADACKKLAEEASYVKA